MIPVYQSIVDKGRGDCMRAVLASMFHLELEAVPHFILSGDKWHDVFTHFILAMGYEYVGCGYAEHIQETEAVNGCYYVAVPSRAFKDVWHAVLVDKDGLVIHDPNPNKAYLGENVVETDKVICLYRIEKIKE